MNPRFHILFFILCTGVALPADPGPWFFIVTGDSRGSDNGVNSVILAEIAREVVAARPDFFFITGDLINGYDPDEFIKWFTVIYPVYQAAIPVYAIRGNHETFLPDPLADWNAAFSDWRALPANGPPNEVNLTWSVPHKNALIVGLDQYVDPKAHNQPWLDAQLDANTRPHVFVAGHLPAFPAIPRLCLDAYPARRDAFWQSLADAGAHLYLASHDHFYDHTRIDDGDGDPDNDLHQYITGTAGAALYEWEGLYEGDNGRMTPVNLAHVERYGYLRIDVDGLDVTVTWTQRHTNDLAAKGVYSPAESWTYSVPALLLRAPNGGEHFLAADVQIRWQTWSPIANLRIEYHDGMLWRPVTDAPVPAATGLYTWNTAGLAPSDDYRVRISDWDNPDTNDTSNAPFAVFRCTAYLQADLNHDCRVDVRDLAILAREWLQCTDPTDPNCL